MMIKIEINCDDAALHDNLEDELLMILNTVPQKVWDQLKRDDGCVCEAKEEADKLRDINGNVVGMVTVLKGPTWEERR